MSNPSGTRIPGRNFLAVPGPTNIPDQVLRSMVVSMEDHRSSKFPELANGVLSDLKALYKTTTGQPFIFPSSGTGAWEAALTNTLSPGDKVVVARFGQFSHLWADMRATRPPARQMAARSCSWQETCWDRSWRILS